MLVWTWTTNLCNVGVTLVRSWDHVGVVLCVSVGFHAHFNIPLSCAALPLVNSPGTIITCTTEADLAARIAAIPLLLRRFQSFTNGII